MNLFRLGSQLDRIDRNLRRQIIGLSSVGFVMMTIGAVSFSLQQSRLQHTALRISPAELPTAMNATNRSEIHSRPTSHAGQTRTVSYDKGNHPTVESASDEESGSRDCKPPALMRASDRRCYVPQGE